MAHATLSAFSASQPRNSEEFRRYNGELILELCRLGDRVLIESGFLPPNPFTEAE
jgi:hypothetical protein